jgi:hypothetical protein
MRKLFFYSTILLVAAVLVVSLNGNAQALICSIDQVTGSYRCADGDEGNTNMNGLNIFGHNDWIYLSKQNTPGSLEEPFDIDLVVEPKTGTNTGTYSFRSEIWGLYDDITIVLKDGGVGIDKIKWFAYGLTDGVSSGSWKYPAGKELSYLAVYGRTGASVPDASIMFLLGSSLLGLAVFGRKPKKS